MKAKAKVRVYSTYDDRVGKLAAELYKEESLKFRNQRIKAKLSVFKDDFMNLIINEIPGINSLYIV